MRRRRTLLAILSCALLVAKAAEGQEMLQLGFQGSTRIEGNPSEVKSSTCFATVSQSGGATGVQAWCIAVEAENSQITGIFTKGTDVGGHMEGGFESSELTTGLGNVGAVSCVVLSLKDPDVAFPPNSTQTIALLSIRATISDTCDQARITYVDHLRGSDGKTVQNTVTRGGQTLEPKTGILKIALSPFSEPCEEPNSQGDIQTSAWNLLLPLTNPYGCDGGGPRNMLRNQVAPRNLAVETPTAGTVWPPGDDLDFQTKAVASGFEAGNFYEALGFSGDPMWVSLAFLRQELPDYIGGLGACDFPRFLDCPIVDLQRIVSRLNTVCIDLGVPSISSDNVLAVAQTYVQNTTLAPICVDVCLSADDSAQVWMNDKVVVNLSQCAAVGADCVNSGFSILDPGINKITVLCWEGAGEWAFRLALRDPVNGTKLSNTNQSDVVFLGTDPAGARSMTDQIAVTRSVENPDCCPLSTPVKVTLRGNGQGTGNVNIREIYVNEPPQSITAISNNGVLTVTEFGFPVISWTVPVSVLDSPTGVSYRIDVPPGHTARPLGRVNDCEAIGGEDQVKGSWPHTGPIGAFEDSHDIGTEDDLTSGPGSLSRTSGPDGVPGTVDDVYTIVGSGVDIWDNGDSFHFAYKRVQGDFEATVRIANRIFPPSGGRWGRYGLMARRNCAPDGKYSLVYANLEADPGPGADHPRGDGVFYQFRKTNRSAAPNWNNMNVGIQFPDPDGNGGPQLVNQPNFFRLVRRGPHFTGYASFDGVSWRLVGSDTWYGLQPGDSLLVGFAYSKHASAVQPGRIAFTDLRIVRPPQPQIFDDDSSSGGRVIYRQDFDGVPDGQLPPGLVSNCAGTAAACATFSPRAVNGRLRLTQEGIGNQATSVFLENVPIPVGTGAVIIDYTVYMTHSGVTRQPPNGDPNPGDGMTLTLLAGRDPRRVGLAGGGLGYQGINGTFATAGPSLAIEADTWSAGYFNEGTGSPTNDGAWHLGINDAGSMHCAALNGESLPNIFGQNGVRLRAIYRSEGRISVSILDPAAGRGGVVEEEMPAAEGTVEPLNSQGDKEGTLGFTGGTGDATETSEVDDIVVTVVDCTDRSERAFVNGQRLARPGTLVILDSAGSNAGQGDTGETLSLSWSASGLATIEGASDGPTVTLRMGSPVEDGEAIGRIAVDDKRCESPSSASAQHTITITNKATNWVTYDGNNDGDFNISDPIAHLNFLFSGTVAPGCPESMDFNGDNNENISDPVAALNFLFSSGAPPARGVGCQLYLFCGLSENCP
jgi:hypothetical protein